jgi:hypothetical protein
MFESKQSTGKNWYKMMQHPLQEELESHSAMVASIHENRRFPQTEPKAF